MNDEETKPEWACCIPFHAAIERGTGGERGINVVVQSSAFGRVLALQGRGISRDDEHVASGKRPGFAINFSAVIAITYCPWCGYSTAKLMKEHPLDFDRLAALHAPLLTPPST